MIVIDHRVFRGADTRVCGVETRLDALTGLISKRRASRRVSMRQAEARATSRHNQQLLAI